MTANNLLTTGVIEMTPFQEIEELSVGVYKKLKLTGLINACLKYGVRYSLDDIQNLSYNELKELRHQVILWGKKRC